MTETDWTTYNFEEGEHYAIQTRPEYDQDEPQDYRDLVFVRISRGGGPVRIFRDETDREFAIDSR